MQVPRVGDGLDEEEEDVVEEGQAEGAGPRVWGAVGRRTWEALWAGGAFSET